MSASLLCLEDHTREATHVVPMGNYVIAGVGNYVIENPSNLGNYVIADTPRRTALVLPLAKRHGHGLAAELMDRLLRAGFEDVRTRSVRGWQHGIIHTFHARRPR